MSRTLAPIMVTFALALTILAAPSTAAPSDQDGPRYGAPEAGHCYLVKGWRMYQGQATAARPRSCRKRHNLWVLRVRTVSANVSLEDLKHPRAGSRFWAFATRACHPSWVDAIGEPKRAFGLSAYAFEALLPTRAQLAHGARWIDCALSIHTARGLLPNRMRTPPRPRSHPAEPLRLCGTEKYAMTTCAAKHAYRATHARVLRARSTKAATTRTHAFCRRVAPHYGMYEWRQVVARVHGWSTFVVTCLVPDPR